MMHTILNVLDKQKQTVLRLIALDFSKAFDSVEPALLVSKLCTFSYGFPNWSVAWFHDFLHLRYQAVKINGCSSNMLSVRRGLPQGTVSGPYLFCAMINDLKVPYDRTALYKYADDQSLLHWFARGVPDCSDSIMTLESEWCDCNHICLNASKTKEIIFSNYRTLPTVAPLNINGVAVQRVRSLKILGLIVDDSLSWEPWIDNLLSRSKSLLFLFRKLKHKCDAGDFKFLILTLLLPVLCYAFPAWCIVSAGRLRKLQTVLNTAGRIGHCSPENITQIAASNTSTLIRAACSPVHPLLDLLPKPRQHPYATRTRDRLVPPSANGERLRRHFVASGVRQLNA